MGHPDGLASAADSLDGLRIYSLIRINGVNKPRGATSESGAAKDGAPCGCRVCAGPEVDRALAVVVA